MKLRKIMALALLAVAFLLSAAPKEVELSGEAVYHDDGSLSRKECMRIAAEEARVAALAKTFGTLISSDMMQSERSSFGRSDNSFMALTSSQVKGEWLGDTREPEYEFSVDAEGNLTVICRVRGKAREITSEAPECRFMVLRNSEDPRNASTTFKDGDEATILFQGSADGYIAIFLEEDDSGKVYCFLPHGNAEGGVKVVRNREYILFGKKSELGSDMDIEVSADIHPEYNRLYLLYSSDPFSLPPMKQTEMAEMSTTDFTKWLLKTRLANPRLGVETVTLLIEPK